VPVQLALPIAAADAVPVAEPPLPRVSDEELALMHRQLGLRLGRPVNVVGTDNRRSLVSWREVDGVLEVRLQRQFALGGDRVVDALVAFIKERDRDARRLLTEFAASFTVPPPRPVFAHPAGKHHDLRDHVARQAHHLSGRYGGRIGWSRGQRGQARQRIRLGSWSSEHKLIRVHPALDSAAVPDWVIGFVVFHEMLHAELGVEDDPEGRRRVHTAEFRAREQAHPDHSRAESWIREHIDHLLTW